MKKFIFLILLTLTACHTAPQEQQFANPLFNEPLEPISRIAWKTFLTPTIITYTNAGYSEIRNCEMLENKWNFILLKCDFPGEKGQWLHKFTIQPRKTDDLRFYGGRLVKEEITNIDNSSSSTLTYVIEEKQSPFLDR